MRIIVRIAVASLGVLGACKSSEVDDPQITPVSASGLRHLAPRYSPDGKRIAWWAPGTDSSGGWQLWVGNADLSSPVKLPVTGGGGAPILWSPDGSRIATISNQFGVAHAVVVPVAGGPAKRLTTGSGVDIPIAWFPDGDRLAYYASAQGGAFTSFVGSLRTGVSAPAVPGEKRPYYGLPSPNGSHIAYTVVDGPLTTVWLADSSGGNPRQLTTEGFESISPTSWSPDGKELLFQSRRTGTADLWVIPIPRGSARQLTRDVRNDFGGSWSGDGKWVGFISERGRQTDLWVVPAAGGVERRITDSPAIEYSPALWRPGTSELAFVVEIEKGGLWTLDLASGTERRLTPDSTRTDLFSVSLDGQQILYRIARGGGIHDLAVMPAAGGVSRVLLAGGGTVNGPRWSPDGSKIVFQSDRGGTNDVWVVDATGGAPRQVVTWPSNESSPAWNSDGSAIFFISNRETRVGDVWKVPVSGREPTRVTTNGSVGNAIVARAGVPDIFAGTINPREGQLVYSRIRPDGTLNGVWERSNAFVNFISPSGDSLIASVEQDDGKMRVMVLSASGDGGRVILQTGEFPRGLSRDGRSLLYSMSVGADGDLGLLRLGDGTKRRLTTTPENESGAEFALDGETVIFRRAKITQRIYSTDLSKLLTTGGK